LLFGVGLPVVLLTYLYYTRGKTVGAPSYDDSDEDEDFSADGLLAAWVNRPGLNADLIWIIAYTVISFTLYAIFVRQDYITPSLAYFVWPPLVVALQIAIAAMVARIFVPRPWNKYGFYLLNGAAAAYFVYAILGRISDVNNTFIEWFYDGITGNARGMISVLTKIAENRLYFVMGIGAITVYMALPFLHEMGSKLRKWRELVLAVSLGMAGWGLYSVFDSFSSEWGPIIGVGWVVFAGMAAMALGALASYGRGIQDALISEICLWLSSSKMRLFVIGVIIVAYVVFLRPYLNNLASWSTALIEWATFCFVVWRLYDGIRGRISDTYSIQLKYTSWKRHMQQVEKQVDGDFSYASNVQADFIERSHKDQLLVYLVTLMHDNAMSVEEISEVLHPLSEYNDEVIPVFSFTKKRNFIRKNNRENREQILKDIMGDLRERDISTT